MDYAETLRWMFSRLPMYQLQGASAYKKDLTNTLKLAAHLGNPERRLKFIHVAGTNGKGSTSHMLASILMEAGLKTGLYTSPHLKDFRERIKIDGKEIPEDSVVSFVAENKQFFEENNLSFFEMTVGLAFDHFEKEKIDVAIIETGLGGRLDSTNIITPLLSVITNIGMDHTQFLGNTLEAIASEKAGIIKPSVAVVIGEYTGETRQVFIEKAEQCNSEIFFAGDAAIENHPSDLAGPYQIRNKKTVLQSIRVLQEKGFFEISEDDIRRGLLNVVKNTGLLGRWQQLGENPKIIADTAHNSHGLQVVMKQLQEENVNTLHLVIGVVKDKDLSDILPLFPKNAVYYFCRPDIPRGLPADELQAAAAGFGLKGDTYRSVADAYGAAKKNTGEDDLIYIGGSTFVVAEIL